MDCVYKGSAAVACVEKHSDGTCIVRFCRSEMVKRKRF